MNEGEFPKKGSSGGGKTPCYSVEARIPSGQPEQVGETIYHAEWRGVLFDKSVVGVPSNLHCRAAEDLGLLSYEAANALRWWFHAAAKSYVIQTRIVKHVIEHNYQETIVSAFGIVGDEENPSFGEPRQKSSTD